MSSRYGDRGDERYGEGFEYGRRGSYGGYTGGGENTGLMLLAGIGLGALLMYVFDPQQGRRRRALLRDKLVGLSNDAGDWVGKTARDLSNRAQGVVAEAGKAVGAGRRAVEIQKTINIAAPVEEVYRFWSEFENFPRFMANVREVRANADGSSHWTVAGPAGTTFEWDAVVTRQVPNQLLAWKSVEGASVENAGVVRFDPNDDGTTRVQVLLSYNPPAGALGHAVAALFGSDPKSEMDEDLVRMKTLVETGNAPHDAAQGVPPQTRGAASGQ